VAQSGSDGRIDVTVLILAKDEEATLGASLAHLSRFDQVVVVDSESTDRTVEIAERLGAEVVQFSWDGRYPKKKQWALEHGGARHPWVLLLDADEFPSDALVDEIAAVVRDPASRDVGAYDIELSYRFCGRLLQHGHVVTKRSLLRPAVTRFPEVGDLDAPGIREVEGHYQPQTQERSGRLRGRIVHDDRDPVSSWFARHNRYSDWEAYLRRQSDLRHEIAGNRSSRGAFFDRVPFKPLVFFIYSYVLRQGFRDGRAGFDYAVALSTYYWQIGVKFRELQRGDLAAREQTSA
jgi:glycosyltransferase involved in cell wall biosynthesis